MQLASAWENNLDLNNWWGLATCPRGYKRPLNVPIRVSVYTLQLLDFNSKPCRGLPSDHAAPDKGGVLYEFECKECGNREDRPYPISSAPPIGHTLTCTRCAGETLRRIPSIPVVNREALEASGKYPYVSHKWSAADLGTGVQTTTEGHPIVQSRAHEREIQARTGMVRV